MRKPFLFCLLASFGMMLMTAPLCAQTKEEKKEAVKAEILKRAEARRFKIRITDVGSNREINQTGIEGSLEVRDTLVISNLPYFGKLRGIQHDSSKIGLNFQSQAYEYLANLLYDGTIQVLFNAKRDNETLVYFIEVKTDGRSTISVHSDKRSPATYIGDMELSSN